MEKRPDSRRSVLRKRYVSDRGGDDRSNIAPGMNRSFTAETWTNIIAKKSWYEAIDEATDMIDDDIETDIQGYDADASVLRAARRNAEEAGLVI